MPDSAPDPLFWPDRETAHALADGWTIHVRGDVVDDGGWSGGHTSGTVGYLGLPDASVEEIIAVLDERRADDIREARTPRTLLVRLTRGEVDVIALEESRLPADGPAVLLWPPTVVPEGVVLRWLRETTIFERIDGQPVGRGQAPRQEGSEPQPGLLVTTDGEVRELPFELNVSPVAVAPGGRLLLPSQDPLWWDGGDEAMTLLALDGAAEPLLACGEPIRPSRVLEAIGEPHANATDPDARDRPGPQWTIRQARFDGDDLVLRLVHGDPAHEPEVEHDREWVTVSVPLSGRWAVRRVATGTLLLGESLPPL